MKRMILFIKKTRTEKNNFVEVINIFKIL